MKLSTRGRYGLRALIDLASHEDEGAVSTQSIAQRQNISESYLEQLIRMLKKGGLVLSVRGAGGGYRLAKRASEISVGDILRCLEGSLDAVECPAIEGSDCDSANACVSKFVWKRINDAIAQAVDSVWLSELVEESHKLQTAQAEESHKLQTAQAEESHRQQSTQIKKYHKLQTAQKENKDNLAARDGDEINARIIREIQNRGL